jgi:hypothetical protein
MFWGSHCFCRNESLHECLHALFTDSQGETVRERQSGRDSQGETVRERQSGRDSQGETVRERQSGRGGGVAVVGG